MNKLKDILQPVLSLFSILQVSLILGVILILNVIYLDILLQNVTISILISLISIGFIFYFIVYIPKKIKRDIYLIKELQKYATHLTFYLKSGYNVLNALEMSQRNLDPEIQMDIQKTIDTLRTTAKLDTSHFKKYKFYSIDIFHKNLEIKYKEGGNSTEIFTKSHQSINFEISKRDELFRKKNLSKMQLLIMMGLVGAIPVILAKSDATSLYNTFVGSGWMGISLIVIFYGGMIIHLCKIYKNFSDLTLR